MYEHAVKAGAALLAARERIPRGGWERWVRENCDLSLRTAQIYTQLARGRPLIEAEAQSSAPRSLSAALAALAAFKMFVEPRGDHQARGDRRGDRRIPASQKKPAKKIESKCRFCADEIARLNARIEELEREITERDLVIAGLRRQLGDDGQPARKGWSPERWRAHRARKRPCRLPPAGEQGTF
jgi:predicted RNase H-like nuclease (RuvC/YqgF family)